MNQNRDKWIDEVLNSTKGMAAAQPRPDIFNKLRSRLGVEMPKGRRMPLEVMSAAAACLLVLFALNIKAVTTYANADSQPTQEKQGAVMEDIIEYYELGSNSVGI